MEVPPYLVAIACAWIIAQSIKYVIAAVKGKNVRMFRQLYLSGNMPSAHSATVIAFATLVGLSEGIYSTTFGLAALVASIVMYDAIMVRRSSGEQGVAIQQLIAELKSQIINPRAAKGHTPLEVLAGALLGLVIGTVVFLATK